MLTYLSYYVVTQLLDKKHLLLNTDSKHLYKLLDIGQRNGLFIPGYKYEITGGCFGIDEKKLIPLKNLKPVMKDA